MIPSGYQPFSQLKDMCGISIEKIEQNNSEELIHGIEKELSEDNVVCIIMKGNCCPWDWRFEETEINGNHEFFIVGVNPQKEEYQCVDPYYSIDEEILPYEYCIKGCHEVFVYKFENKVWEKEQLIKKLEQEREYWDKTLQSFHDLSDHLQQFVEESLALMNTGEELSGAFEFVNNNIIYHIMEDIANNRIRFVWFLEYLKERDMIHTDKFSEDFIDISKMWNTIKKMYVKNLYRGKTDVDNLKDKIKEISIYENDILNQLMGSVNVLKQVHFHKEKQCMLIRFLSNLKFLKAEKIIYLAKNRNLSCHIRNITDFVFWRVLIGKNVRIYLSSNMTMGQWRIN